MHPKHNLPAAGNEKFAAPPSLPVSPPDGYLPARHVRKRYRVSDMTIWRWLRDEQMGFPQPVYLGRCRYWRIADIEAWEASQAAARGAA